MEELMEIDYKKFGTGALESPRDDRDKTLNDVIKKEEKDDLLASSSMEFKISYPLQPYNQGQYGQCVAFSLAKIKEVQEFNQTGVAKRFSTSYIYMFRDFVYRGEGMYSRQALKNLKLQGVCEYEDFSQLYHYSQITEVEGKFKTLLPSAYGRKIKGYIKLEKSEDIKAFLLKYNTPLMVIITAYDSFYKTGKDGIVKPYNGNKNGGHAMVLIGWKIIDGVEHWIVSNSWDKSWGDNGNCYFNSKIYPFQEIWGIVDENLSKEASIPNEVRMTIGDKIYYTDGIKKEMDVPPMIIENRTLVPLRVIAETMGYNVEWQQDKKRIILKKGGELYESDIKSFDII
jgi:hypothetical protein